MKGADDSSTLEIYHFCFIKVLYWFYSSIGGYQVSGVYQFLSYFLPLIHQMQEYDDQDLQQLSSTVSKIYPNFPHAPHMISDVLIQMTSVLMNNQVGWRPKIHTLPMLQVLFYRHLPLLDKTIELHIMESIAGLLQDHQVEVREAASITLSGLIRCSQRDSMLRLKQDFCKQLTENPVHKRRRGDTAASGSLSSLAHESLVRRHSAVLGLSSIVMAFPYDVPELIPDVLVLLAGCISDPAPVSVSGGYGEKKGLNATRHRKKILPPPPSLIPLVLGDVKENVCGF